MIRSLPFVIIAFALFAATLAWKVQRQPGATAGTRWSVRGSMLLSVAILIGTVPGMIWPTVTWLRTSASIVSFLITLTTIYTLRRTVRANRAAAARLR